jgi:ferredoxin-NADP reductase
MSAPAITDVTHEDRAARHWTEAEVLAVEDVATGIRRIVLRPAAEADYSEPGCHVDVVVGTRGDASGGPGRTATRSYSVVSCDPAEGTVTLGVQRAAPSRGGSAFMHSLTAGSRLSVSRPRQGFPLRYGAGSYLLLAGGVGITALVGMAEKLRARGADYRLVYVARSADRLAFAEELRARHADRLRMWSTDTAPLDVATLVGEAAPDAEMYVCGPVPLLHAVREAWTATARRAADLRFETFGGPGRDTVLFTLRVPRLGVETEVRRDESMLDALERAGVEVMYDCLRGECGLCLADVLDTQGRIDHRDVFLSRDEKDRGDRLCMCISRMAPATGTSPVTPVVSVDLP